jgi:hypothetical protein
VDKSQNTAKPERGLNLLNDYLFLNVMGEKGDEEQLLGFLNAVIQSSGGDKLVSVEIVENKLFTPEVIGDKSSVLDLRARQRVYRRSALAYPKQLSTSAFTTKRATGIRG